MRRKSMFSSSVGILVLVLMLIFPHVSSAGTVSYRVYNSTGTKNFNHSFSHDASSNPTCTSSPAKFTNNMQVSLGTVTNSSIRVNNHKVNPSISSGTLHGGRAVVFSTTQYVNNLIYGVKLGHNSNRTITWNRSMPINASNKDVVVSQHFFPSSYAGSDFCELKDSFVFTHSTFLSSFNNDSSIKPDVDSLKVKNLEENIKSLGFNKVSELSEGTMHTKAFVLDDILLDISIHYDPVEILDVIDTQKYGGWII